MKAYFAYIRVSTKDQEDGASPSQQRAAIEAYAARQHLPIGEWFEETKTAAKQGRPVFIAMMKLLRKGNAQGVIVHKIDRSARNGHDWAAIGDLVDAGIEVHFAHETLDMRTRGGRLAADIQAVVAADYIRNLKQEVQKGQEGRLKEGLYPWGAPVGYKNEGKGKAKTIDPIQGPLVRKAFELYATGDYNYHTLKAEMDRCGLRNTRGKPLMLNSFTCMLNSPFYIGLIHLKAYGKTFQGVHEPLIPVALFDRVQRMLRGNRLAGAKWKHDLTFRKTIRCTTCGTYLIGEKQKGRYVYYRCHTRPCTSVCVSETAISDSYKRIFDLFQFDEEELREMRDLLAERKKAVEKGDGHRRNALKLAVANCDDRLSRLTDALIDGVIEKDVYDAKQSALRIERKRLEEEMKSPAADVTSTDLASEYLELANTAYVQLESANPSEIRSLVSKTTSNLSASGKTPAITLKKAFHGLYQIRKSQLSALNCDKHRTITKRIVDWLIEAAEEQLRDTMSLKS